MNELSIIIPTLNEENYLPLLLASIAGQNFQGKLQVIVVDGQSNDKTVRVAKKFAGQIAELEVLTATPNAGRQRNVGADKAKFEYLLFLDADVILPPNFLNRLAPKIKISAPFVAAVSHVAPKMSVLDTATLAIVYILFFISWLAGTPVTNGDFILTNRENHRRINGFKEGAILGEDTDYGVRSVKRGAKYKFYFSPHIIASDRRVREMGRWRLLVVWSKVFIRVRRHGPTYSGVDYPFGHYGQDKEIKPED